MNDQAQQAVLILRAGAALGDVQPALRKLKLHAEPMHPGVADAGLAAYYILKGDHAAGLAEALPELLEHPSVDAAYLKGGDAPPA